MRIPKFLLLLAVAELATLDVCLAQSQVVENKTGSAFGTVLMAMNYRPVDHAQVDVHSLSTEWASTALTGADGKFDVTGMPLGQYRLTVTAPLCEPYEILVMVEERTGPLSLELTKASPAPTPVDDEVVSVHELKMSGKGEPDFNKGTRLLQKGDARGSLVYFERALAKDPGYYRAYHNLGLAQYKLGERAQAEDSFQRAIDLTNGGFAPPQFALGMILLENRQFRHAETVVERGLVMEPGSALGKYVMGLVQFALNRLPEAERSAHDALHSRADLADAHILLARIHERENNPYAVKTDVAAYLKLDGHGPLEDEAKALLERARVEITQNTNGGH